MFKVLAQTLRFRERWKYAPVRLAVSAFLIIGMLLPSLALQVPTPVSAAGNPITLENQNPGTTDWQLDFDSRGNSLMATNHQIEGYASLTSVNAGSPISFMVNLSSSAQYTMKIYRMGYYPTGTNADGSTCSGGCGGRLMQSIGPLNGSAQPACPRTTTTVNFGLTECNWAVGSTLTVPTTWTTGNYIVKLQRSDTKLESYMTFVVRNDAGAADIVLSTDVSTWQAYNMWGGSGYNNVGYDLYGQFNDVTGNTINSTRAYAVSFNRPYLDQSETDGAGMFFVWDYPMIRWLEAQGYNVTYATDVDMETNPNLLSGRKAFINTGHDEYYSDNMRSNLQGYINGGAHMGFFSANNIFYRIRWVNSSGGQSYRTVVCYKDAALDPESPDTIKWRDLTPPQPENSIDGMLQNGTASDRAFRVYDSTNWIYAGTGLANYVSGTPITSGSGQNAIAGIVGYEFDERAANDASLSAYTSYEPAGLQQVAHSAIPAGDNGVAAFSDATVYTASSGAIVFAAGTLQWSWGLDNGYNTGYCNCNTGYANSKSQQITANVLNKFLTTTTSPPVASLSPTSLTFASQAVNSTSPSQSVTLSNTGGAPMTISGISITGTNSTNFAQTNTCPTGSTTLAAGANCTINVTFTPSASGTRSATLSVSDNAQGSPQGVALSGTGASAPAVSFSSSSLTFSSQLVNTTSPQQTVTLTNSGSAALTISSIGFTGTNPGDFADTTTCPFSPSTLAAGGACTINVTFTPTASGTRTANLSVTDDAVGSPQTVSLSGTGTATAAPAVSLSPTSLAFGSQTMNTPSAPQTVTLTNSGSAALTISSIGFTGTNPGDFSQTNTCPASTSSLAVGASCTISVTYKPTITGNESANLTITDNAANSPQAVALSGTGAPAGIYLTDGFESGSLNNWKKTSSSGGSQKTQTTVVNSGTNAAALTNKASTDYAGLFANLSSAQTLTYSRFCFYLSGISGTTPLAQGRDVNGNNLWEVDYDTNSKGLDIYFWNGARTRTNLTSPSNLIAASKWYCAEVKANETSSGSGQVWLNGTSVATVSANLSVTNPYSQLYLWNNGAAGTIYMDDIQVASGYNGPVGAGATPLPAPAVTLSPASLTFASQNINTTSGTQSITLTNSGNAPLTISSIGLSGSNASDFSESNTCPLSPSTIAAGGTCSISVAFKPTATGARTATISVTDNAGNVSGTTQSVSLSGTGAAPAVSFTPTSLTFASQTVNTNSTAQTVTLTNSGNSTLTISSIGFSGSNAGDFVQTNTCPISPSTLAAGAACTISVTFNPSATGTRSGSLSVADNAGNSPQTVALTGTGSLPAGTYLTDGFENGLHVWTTTTGGGSASTQSTTVNSGTSAAALANGAGQLIGLSAGLAGGGQTLTYTRFCFNLPSNTTTIAPLAQGRNANGTNMWEIDYNAGTKGLDIYLWNGAGTRSNLSTPANLISANTWYCAELQDNETSTGSAQVWLNGTSVASASNLNLSTASPYSQIYLWNQVASSTVYLDDVIVSNAYNGPVGAGATPLPAPAVTFNPTSLTFASQVTNTASAVQTLTLTNSGNAAMTISGISITGTNSGDFAQTNNCPVGSGTLAAGANCTISVTFTPAATGSRSASLSVGDNAIGSPHTVALSGTGVAPAVTLSPTTLSFGSQQSGTTSAAQTVTLTNSGSSALTISSIGMSGVNSGDFAQTNTCPLSPSTLAAGSTCTISVTFTPTVNGSESASVSVASNAPGSPHTVALSGSGVAPGVTLSPTSLTFASQVTNTTSAAQTVTLTNSGSAALTISAVGITGTNASDFAQTNTCPLSPSTLAAGSTCTISVTFTPLAGGTRTASVSITDNAGNSPQTVALSGTGSPPAGTYLSDGFESGLGAWSIFAGGGSATTESTTVNSGTSAASLTNGAGQLVGLSAALAGGGQTATYTRFCFNLPDATVTLAPLAQGRNANGGNAWEIDYDAGLKGLDIYLWNGAGARTDMYTAANLITAGRWYCAELQDNETSAGSAQVWLNGTTVANVSGVDLSTSTPYSQLYLWNQTPSSTVYLDDVIVSNAYNGPVGSGTSPLSVTAMLNVARMSSLSTISRSSGKTTGASSTVATDATTFSPSSLDFGSQKVGTTSAAKTITITNSGSTTLTMNSISVTGSGNLKDFAQTNTCPSSLAVGASCTVSVTFKPSATGTRTVTISVNNHAVARPHTIVLTGTGV